MGVTERLDRFQRRHPGAGFPIAVLYKYADDAGHFLGALLTYYAFLALFPLLLLSSTILGLLLRGNPELQQALIDSALREFPVIGPQLGVPERLGGGVTGLVVGTLVALYGALGMGQALQYTMNTAWSVPKAHRPDVIMARVRSLLLVLTFGLLVLGTTLLSALAAGAAASGTGWGVGLNVLLTAASVLVNAGIFVLAFRLTTARRLTVRDVAPGALLAAVGWQLLQWFGGVYVASVVKGASSVNAVFALVLGMFAFLYLASAVLVLCVEINVVRVDRLHPRALLGPFIEDVDLTEGDERVYTDAAKAERARESQRVDVHFEDNGGGGRPEGAEPEVADRNRAAFRGPES